MPTPPETLLLRHVLETPEEAVPEAARAAARVFLLDTLAAGIAGTAHADQPRLLAAAGRWGSGAEAGLWGGAACLLPAAQAAFVNAFQAHALEFDAVHEPAFSAFATSASVRLDGEMDRPPLGIEAAWRRASPAGSTGATTTAPQSAIS